MEEEARQILRAALQSAPPPAEDLATRVRARFAALGDVQLSLQPREPVRPPPELARAAKRAQVVVAAGSVKVRRRA